MFRGRNIAIAAVAAGVVAVTAFVAAGLLGADEASAAEVTLQSLGSSGGDAFTPSVAPPPAASLADFANTGAVSDGAAPALQTTATAQGYLSADGTVTGVFGGTLDEQTCDRPQLVAFLSAEPLKASAWASALDLEAADIPAYVEGLTAANLGFDTRVLDHGFSDGELVTREAILQRGSAVLVDSRGVARVNCYSGNPLRNPSVVEDEVYVGTQWASFEATKVLIITPAPEDRQEFVLFDVASGSIFRRPAGTAGESDQPAEVVEATPAPTTQELPDTVALELNVPVAGEIGEGQSEIVYEFEAPDSAVLTLSASNDRASVGRVAFELRSEGNDVTFFRVSQGGSEEFRLTLDHAGGALFELTVREGPGAFQLMVASEIQNDAGQGGDAGDDFAAAFEVASGELVEGVIADFDMGDRYVIPVEGAPALILSQTSSRSSGGRAAFTVEFEGDQVHFGRVSPGADDAFSLLLGSEDEGLWEVFVSEGPAEYSFTADLVPQNDGGQPGDASGELAEARMLDPAEPLLDLPGEVGDRDRADLYLFEATAPSHTLAVSVDPLAASRVAFEIVGPDGNSIRFFRVQPGVEATEVFEATPGETYRLLVTEGRGAYTFSVE